MPRPRPTTPTVVVTARIPTTLRDQLIERHGSITQAILSLDTSRVAVKPPTPELPKPEPTQPPEPRHLHRRTSEPTLIRGIKTWTCTCGATLN